MSLDTATVESTSVEAPITETPEAPAPAVSIADHAAQFSPDRKEPAEGDEIPKTPANTGQFANKPPDARHRASTQRASPEDVETINKLTKELRELEGKVGEKDPDAKAAPRIKTLQRQIRALKALEAPAAEPQKPLETKAALVQQTATAFEDKEPDINDFANETDPYLAWHKAWNRWDRKRESFEVSQAQATERDEAARAERVDRFHVKQSEFVKANPDYVTVTQPFFERQLPPVLLNAIVRDDNGPALVYHLAQHPEFADQLVFDTIGKPLDDALVAHVQRRLTQALAPAQAVHEPDRPPKAPSYIPPKPPNPVRTGPIKTADEPPAQASSIAEHQKYFGPKRR